jgi:hypothetical protein
MRELAGRLGLPAGEGLPAPAVDADRRGKLGRLLAFAR